MGQSIGAIHLLFNAKSLSRWRRGSSSWPRDSTFPASSGSIFSSLAAANALSTPVPIASVTAPTQRPLPATACRTHRSRTMQKRHLGNAVLLLYVMQGLSACQLRSPDKRPLPIAPLSLPSLTCFYEVHADGGAGNQRIKQIQGSKRNRQPMDRENWPIARSGWSQRKSAKLCWRNIAFR